MAKITLHIELDGEDTLHTALAKLLPPKLESTVTAEQWKRATEDWEARRAARQAARSTEETATGGMTQEEKDIHADVAQQTSDAAAAVAAGVEKTTQETNTTPAPLGPMDGNRKRGEAVPGHRRRTNAQIKEDEAYLAQVAALNSGLGVQAGVIESPTAATTAELAPAIDPAEAAQDAADEAAETAARKTDKPTLEDLRAVVGRYTDKYGPKATIDNIRKILGRPMIEVPEAELGDAIARVEAAISEEPRKTEIIVGESASAEAKAHFAKDEPPPHATKADVVDAITAYGRKYEGTDKPAEMILTREDMPKILMKLFGEGVKTIPAIPQTPESYGKALAAINAAVRDNPFKREVKA